MDKPGDRAGAGARGPGHLQVCRVPVLRRRPGCSLQLHSGSAVIDVNNTSGFFDGTVAAEARIVAIYTLNTPTEQTQDIAYSRDGGYTFTKYEGNPVISINSTQFRDPKVFWDAQAQLWVMAVAHTQSWEIGFYTVSALSPGPIALADSARHTSLPTSRRGRSAVDSAAACEATSTSVRT